MLSTTLPHKKTQSALLHFLGSWDFERSISNPPLRTNGIAQFEKTSECTLTYYEFGTYTINEVSYDFFQKRYFVFNLNSVSVYKNDHSLLHRFELNEDNTSYPTTLKHVHLCGADTYTCTLTSLKEKHFEMHYSVNGTNKNYEIKTIYTKT